MADKMKILYIVEVMGRGMFIHINFQSIVATPELKVAA